MKLTLEITENEDHNIAWKIDIEKPVPPTPREAAFGYYSAILLQSNIHAVLCMIKDLQDVYNQKTTEAKPETKL